METMVLDLKSKLVPHKLFTKKLPKPAFVISIFKDIINTVWYL